MSDLPPHLKAYVDQMEAGLEAQQGDDFERLGENMFAVAVCTSLTDEEATARLALTPSGTSGGWQLSTDPDLLPKPCDEKPGTHRHLLFEC